MEPALKARFRAVGSRSQTFGLSIDTLWTPGASKGRSARRLLFQSSPLRRPLRARDPTGSDAFAVAPYRGGSYLTPAKWQICDGSCSQKPRTRTRTGGADSSSLRRDPPHGFSFHKRVDPPVPFKRQERTRSAVAALGVPHSRDWYWRAARGGPVTAIGPGSKFRPDRCRHLSRPLLQWPASPTKERGGRP